VPPCRLSAHCVRSARGSCTRSIRKRCSTPARWSNARGVTELMWETPTLPRPVVVLGLSWWTSLSKRSRQSQPAVCNRTRGLNEHIVVRPYWLSIRRLGHNRRCANQSYASWKPYSKGSWKYRSPFLKPTRKTWQSGLFLDAPVPDFTDACRSTACLRKATDQCMWTKTIYLTFRKCTPKDYFWHLCNDS